MVDLTNFENSESILWLRESLGRVLPKYKYMSVQKVRADMLQRIDRPKIDAATTKAIRIFQVKNRLPNTGKPDVATVQALQQELQKL